MSAPTRAAVQHCPYCADEDLHPVVEPHGAWECRSCLRVFSVRLVGLARPAHGTTGTGDAS